MQRLRPKMEQPYSDNVYLSYIGKPLGGINVDEAGETTMKFGIINDDAMIVVMIILKNASTGYVEAFLRDAALGFNMTVAGKLGETPYGGVFLEAYAYRMSVPELFEENLPLYDAHIQDFYHVEIAA